jgi:putative ABC transport system permease protein
MLQRFRARLRSLWNWNRQASDLDEEIRFHLTEEADEQVAAGLPPEQARLAAKRNFGNVALIRATTHDVWVWAWLRDLGQDVRFAGRLLLRDRWFTATAVLTLAVGMGANAAVFIGVNAVLVHDLPMPDPDRVMALWSENDRGRRFRTSGPDYEDWLAETRSFSVLSAFYGDEAVNVGGNGRATERARSAWTSPNHFELFGRSPMIGRGFVEADDQLDAGSVAVLGHRLWQVRYDSDPAVLGSTLRVNGEVAAIVGVMPPGIHFPTNVDIFMPLAQLPPDVQADRRDRRILRVFGRLADGVSVEQARAELAGIGQRLSLVYPSTNEQIIPTLAPESDRAREGLWVPLLLVQAAVAFVFLIACANVANLLLVRAARRSGEMSVRAALGASRWRVVRQLLVESSMLASIAGVAGFGLSVAGVRWMVYTARNDFQVYELPELAVDWVVLAFLAVVGLTTVVFGLTPALLASRTDVNRMLKEGGRAHGGGLRLRRWTSGLIVAELALTLGLLASAGVMVRGFLSQYWTDPGVETSPLLTMRVSMLQPKYSAVGARTALFEQLEARLDGVAAIEASAIATRAPLQGGARRPLLIEGRSPSDDEAPPRVTTLLVGDAYFDTLGVALLRGRVFTPSDGLPGQETAIVNRRFATMHFGGDDPVGRRVKVARLSSPGDLDDEPWLTIVGVTPDIRQVRDETAQTPVVYRPHRTESPRNSVLIVRARDGHPADLTTSVLDTARSLDPDLSFFFIWTMDQLLTERLTEFRFLASGTSVGALLALLFSAVGLYAVTAYAASQRTREIGLRVALGARPSQVQWLVLRLALWQLAIGVTIGGAGALGVGRVLGSQLRGTSSVEPATLISIVAILTSVALLACVVPARRAARLDPMVALRHE